MYKTHTTTQGKSMLVCEMGDQHLVNTIKFFCRKLQIVVEKARASQPLDRYEKALYGLKQISPEDAADLTRRMAEVMAPYVLEATLRGLSDQITKDIQLAYSRDKAVALPAEIALLRSGETVTIVESVFDEDSWMLDPEEQD